MFLGSSFDEYLLGDGNQYLIELYRAAADKPHEFVALASSYFEEANRSPERYQEIRTAFNREGICLVRPHTGPARYGRRQSCWPV